MMIDMPIPALVAAAAIGTAVGITLDRLWMRLKSHINGADSEPPIAPPVSFGEPEVVSTNENTDRDRLYLRSLEPMFREYGVNIQERNAFGLLCNQIQRKIRIDLLDSLAKQTSPRALLDVFQTESVRLPRISFQSANSGPYVLDSYLMDASKNLGLPLTGRESLERKVQQLLNTYYAKGIEAVLVDFGKSIEELKEMERQGDPALEKRFKTLKENLEFNLSLLRR